MAPGQSRAFSQSLDKPPGRSAEDRRVLNEAMVAYYLVEPEAVRTNGRNEQFLFLADDPDRSESVWNPASALLVLAQRDVSGHFLILWRRHLPSGAFGVAWWDHRGGRRRSAFIVHGARYLVFYCPKGTLPVYWKTLRERQSQESLGFGFGGGSAFFAAESARSDEHLLYGMQSLYDLDLETDELTPFWRADSSQWFGALLAGSDLDGDSSVDVIAATSRFISRTEQRFPAILRVWHFDHGRLKQVHEGAPQRHWPMSGRLVSL